MKMIAVPLLLTLPFLAAATQPVSKFPIGKETTYVTGPLDKDGYIDYEAALNELLGKGITAETNANVLLWKAIGPTPDGKSMPAEYFKILGMTEPPKEGAYFIGLKGCLEEHLKLDPEDVALKALLDKLEQAEIRPWTPKDYPHFAAWLKANEQPLAVVIEAAGRADYFNPIVSSSKEAEKIAVCTALVPNVYKYRELAHALAARAMLQIGARKFDEAWQDLLACHRLGRLVARGATLIDCLGGIQIDNIASTADLAYLERANLTAKHVQDRLKDLRSLSAVPPPADKVELGERFMGLDGVRIIRRGGVGIRDFIPSREKPSAEDLKALESVAWGATLRIVNPWYDRLVTALRLTDPVDRIKAINKMEIEFKALVKKTKGPLNSFKLLFVNNNKTAGKAIGEMLMSVMYPSVLRVQNTHDRTEQTHRNLHIAFALAAYRSDLGRYPAKLDDLAPIYLPSVPNDLFSGKALIYRPSDQGYLLYSVGVNGRDEEGRTFDDSPQGDDVSVHMPLPELKR
jgi:hypothetical protein